MRWSDRQAGRAAHMVGTLGQAGLVALGVHLAADQLDDRVLALLQRVWEQPPAVLAPGVALGAELATDALLISSFLLTPRLTRLRDWRPYLSVQALVLPITLAGVLLAGAWSLSMAAEDLLPSSFLARPAAWALGAAAALRFGWPAWTRSVTALSPGSRWTQGLLGALLLVPIGVLAWTSGVPLWSWLP